MARITFADMTSPQNDIQSELIPIEYVKTGYSLAVDRGQGAQVFVVHAVKVQSARQDNGEYLTRYTLRSEPVDGGDPWTLEVPAGGFVTVLYQKGRRPAALPPR